MAGIRALLDKYDVRPSRKLGQNFLVHEGYLKAIAAASGATESDVVLEIGAGIGNLTRLLASSADKVLAMEFDRDMLRVLEGELDAPNVEIIESDALDFDFGSLEEYGKLLAVANLPYNIATEITFRLFDARRNFRRMVLTTQLEVARRYAARVNASDYGVLAVTSQMWADVKLEMKIPAGAFYPRPKVDSGVVRFEMRDGPAAPVGSPELFSKIVHGAFSQRRKMLLNSLSSYAPLALDKQKTTAWLEKAGIDPKKRAQNLSVEDFARLENAFPE